MNLVFYDDSRNVVEVIEDIQNPVIDGDNIEWEKGEMTGIKLSFLVLCDDTEIGESVTDELILLDKKKEFITVDLAEENKQLREQIEMNALAFMEFIEMWTKGEI